MQEPKARILCVDDDADTCEMVKILLGQFGHEVVTALTVTEGLRLAKNDPCDLILLDWHFDDGTGLELCQMIRTFNKDVPILFYTGEADERAVKSGANAGAQGYLIKPCSVEKLQRAIGLLVSQKRVAELKTQSRAPIETSREIVENYKQRPYKRSQLRFSGIND
jgi:DNA-binding response OmpR family regulator